MRKSVFALVGLVQKSASHRGQGRLGGVSMYSGFSIAGWNPGARGRRRPARRGLTHDVFGDDAGEIGQAVVSAAVAVGQFFVIQAQ